MTKGKLLQSIGIKKAGKNVDKMETCLNALNNAT